MGVYFEDFEYFPGAEDGLSGGNSARVYMVHNVGEEHASHPAHNTSMRESCTVRTSII